MPKLILLNGAPRSGKDECAKHLYKLTLGPPSIPFPHWFRMSQPIKDAIRATWGWTEAEQAAYEKQKDKPFPELGGKSYRQLQIAFSEDFLKVQCGPRIFGEIALRHLRRSIANVFVCSDSGFAEEVMPLLNMFDKHDILLMKLHRPGYTFAGDSRDYIRIPGVREVHVQNDSALSHLTSQVETLVKAWLNGDAD